jgi:uncharacterized protein YjiS (DUF1127 family)
MPFDGSFGVASTPSPRWRAMLDAWRRNRRARQRLDLSQKLDPRFARDIGLTQTELAIELERPFWSEVDRRSSV